MFARRVTSSSFRYHFQGVKNTGRRYNGTTSGNAEPMPQGKPNVFQRTLRFISQNKQQLLNM
jgi:hypothetical protein